MERRKLVISKRSVSDNSQCPLDNPNAELQNHFIEQNSSQIRTVEGYYLPAMSKVRYGDIKVSFDKNFLPVLVTPKVKGGIRERIIKIDSTREVVLTSHGSVLPTAEDFYIFSYLMATTLYQNTYRLEFPSKTVLLRLLNYQDNHHSRAKVLETLKRFSMLQVEFNNSFFESQRKGHIIKRVGVPYKIFNNLIIDFDWPSLPFGTSKLERGLYITFNEDFLSPYLTKSAFFKHIDLYNLSLLMKNSRALSLYLWLKQWVNLQTFEYMRELPVSMDFFCDCLGWDCDLSACKTMKAAFHVVERLVVCCLNFIARIDPTMSFVARTDIPYEEYHFLFIRNPLSVSVLAQIPSLVNKLPNSEVKLAGLGYSTFDVQHILVLKHRHGFE